MSLELSHTHLSTAAFALQWQNSRNRHCLAHKAKNIHYLAPSGKSVPSPALEALSLWEGWEPQESCPRRARPSMASSLVSPQPWGIQMLVSVLSGNCSYLMAWNTSPFPVMRCPKKTQEHEIIRNVAESVSFPSSSTLTPHWLSTWARLTCAFDTKCRKTPKRMMLKDMWDFTREQWEEGRPSQQKRSQMRSCCTCMTEVAVHATIYSRKTSCWREGSQAGVVENDVRGVLWSGGEQP